MDWISFEDSKPDEGKWIIYGNHRYVKTMKYSEENARLTFDEKLAFLNITHWSYIELPPVSKEFPKWSKNETQSS